MKYISDLINFELWFTYSGITDQKKIYELTVQLAIEDIKLSIQKYNTNCIVGMLLVDGFLYKDNEDFYLALEQIYNEATKLGIAKFFLIVGMCADYQRKLNERNLNYEIIDWNFPVNQLYYSYENRFNEILPWNPKSEKFLFLGGVPSRKNRIGLLSNFYDAKLMNKSVWSFFPPWEQSDIVWCRDYLSKYNDEEYSNFLNSCSNNLDEKYSSSKNYSRVDGKTLVDDNLLDSPWLNDCGYLNPLYFNNTAISVLTAGSCYAPATDYKFLTEETWRAILNNHPFILADHPDRFTYMKSLGLDTFEQYFLYPDYWKEDEEKRLEQVVANVKYFIDTCRLREEDIKKSIAHNLEVFKNIKNNNFKTINYLKDSFNLRNDSIKQYLEVVDFKTFIRVPDK
jgi:hypothetical protein